MRWIYILDPKLATSNTKIFEWFSHQPPFSFEINRIWFLGGYFFSYPWLQVVWKIFVLNLCNTHAMPVSFYKLNKKLLHCQHTQTRHGKKKKQQNEERDSLNRGLLLSHPHLPFPHLSGRNNPHERGWEIDDS